MLKTVRALLEKGWCQHAYARDAEGRRVMPNSPEAVQFCLTGALMRCENDYEKRHDIYYVLVQKLLSRRCIFRGTRSDAKILSDFNDDYGKESVLKLIDEVIMEADNVSG